MIKLVPCGTFYLQENCYKAYWAFEDKARQFWQCFCQQCSTILCCFYFMYTFDRFMQFAHL